jgi:caffeoyl-CoA O-methyltransferase
VFEGDENILTELIDYTYKEKEAPNMISGNMVGNLLCILAKSISAKKVLDVGMFTGYSALKLASSIPEDGEVHTFELAENHIKSAQKFFDKSNYNNIIIHKGKALKNLETLPADTFNFAFIDADKINYIEYYKRCMILIKKGGIIVLDNMLWSGKVLNPDDEDSIALNNTAKFINEDKRVFNHLIPIRDGLMVCVKNG